MRDDKRGIDIAREIVERAYAKGTGLSHNDVKALRCVLADKGKKRGPKSKLVYLREYSNQVDAISYYDEMLRARLSKIDAAGETAVQFGVSEPTVHRWVRKYRHIHDTVKKEGYDYETKVDRKILTVYPSFLLRET